MCWYIYCEWSFQWSSLCNISELSLQRVAFGWMEGCWLCTGKGWGIYPKVLHTISTHTCIHSIQVTCSTLANNMGVFQTALNLHLFNFTISFHPESLPCYFIHVTSAVDVFVFLHASSSLFVIIDTFTAVISFLICKIWCIAFGDY